MVKLTGGQIVVRCLENEGVDIVFGMPGINVLHLYDALRQSLIHHVLVRHEQSASFMADAYARVTGKTGVCITTAGPGLTNALTGLATAYSDSIRVLLLAGEISSNLIGKKKGVLHEIDQTSLASPVTRRAYCVLDVRTLPKIIHQAFKNLGKERLRPLYIGLPDDILENRADFRPLKPRTEVTKRRLADAHLIDRASTLLSKSHFPVILAGGGVVSSEASSELVEVAEFLSAPVVTTVMGAGAIPGDHPLFLGRSRMPKVIDEVFQRADVMLAVGTRFSSLSMKNWTLKAPKNLIHVDIDREEIGRNYPTKVGVHGDAKCVLQQVAKRLGSMPRIDRPDWRRTWKQLKDSTWEELKNNHPTEVEIVMNIRSALERNAIVTADTTILSYWMQRIFPIYEPRTFLYPFGYVAMGYALPAAIASKIALPDTQVIAICGDGGFMVTCQDLATAVENKLGIPIILWNNKSYGILKHLQDQHFGGRHIGVDLSNPDFVKLAESFGGKALKASMPDQILPCLREALQSNLPTIIEVEKSLSPPS
jgi:thiamine pyrophosphate-dependent acetolactate synthase large subunit-like protein